MRNGSVSISLLEEFSYLGETLNFKQTADHFYVSRSVISRHISALEEAVDAKLINRDSRTVELTEAGVALQQEAKTILQDWETALERVHVAAEGNTLLVRVGYLRNAARPVLVKFVKHMAQAQPKVRLSLTCMDYAQLRNAMEKHTVDIAVAMNVNPEISRNYRSTRLYEDNFYVVSAADNPLVMGKSSLTIEDLRNQKILLPDSFADVGLSELVRELTQNKERPIAQSFYRDSDMLYLKVQTEHYIAFSSGMNNAQFDDGIVTLPIENVNTSFAVSAFYQDDLAGEAFLACREGFEWCGKSLAHA